MNTFITTALLSISLLNTMPKCENRICIAFNSSFAENSRTAFTYFTKQLEWPLIISNRGEYTVVNIKRLKEFVYNLLIKGYDQNTLLAVYKHDLVRDILPEEHKSIFDSGYDSSIVILLLECLLNKNPISMPIQSMMTISLSQQAAIIGIYKTSYEDFIHKFGRSISVRQVNPDTPYTADNIFPCVIQFIPINFFIGFNTRNRDLMVIPDLQTLTEFIELLDDKNGYLIHWSFEQISKWSKNIAYFALGESFYKTNSCIYPEYFFPSCKNITGTLNNNTHPRRAKQKISWDTICINRFILITPDGQALKIDSNPYKIMHDFPNGSFLEATY